ncbi:MAG: copper resistance protein NlpE N-terminal domain-containing protein [Ginsengibacter sp.]
MKFLKATLAFSISILLFSCQDSSKKLKEDNAYVNTPILPIDYMMDPVIEKDSITGIYQGIFPCFDCNGLEQVLLLKDNFTFKQAYVNVDSNKIISTSKGEWEIVENRIVLSKNHDYYISFGHRNDSIFAVDINKIPIKTPEMYALKQQKFAENNPEWKTEKKKGISFAARGTEPSWTLNIKNNIIYFKFHDQKNVLIAEKEAMELEGNSTTYHLTTNNKAWKVTIKDQFCKKGLDEAIYEYEVFVDYEGNEYAGCGVGLAKD